VLFNNVPDAGTTPLPTNDCAANPHGANDGFYNCPVGLGVTRHAIGSARQIQMSLHLDF
jgi:hypothetical protein